MPTVPSKVEEQVDLFRTQLYRYLNKQTGLPYLILYTYLFWYLFLMVTVGAKHMSLMAWLNGIFVALFVFFALNAAAYQAPLCGPRGYLKHPFKIGRFFAIPFCVSTSSIACSMAGDEECMLLFATDHFLCIMQIVGMVVIFVSGLFIHCIVSPLLAKIDKLEKARLKVVEHSNDPDVEMGNVDVEIS